MTSIYLVRHAESLGNAEQRFQGHTDHPLTELGRQQAFHVGQRFRALPVDHIYSSPLQRARDTAGEIGAQLRLPVWVEPRLIEIGGGDMENIPFDTLAKRYPEQYRSFIHDPDNYAPVGDGETFREVYNRVREFLDEIASRHKGETLVLVSHGSALRCMLCYAMGKHLSELRELPIGGNTAVSHILMAPYRTLRVVYCGDMTHLPRSMRTKMNNEQDKEKFHEDTSR